MGRFIMKLHDSTENKDLYFEWSTVVDSPVTVGMSLEEFKEYYKNEYGSQGMRELDERLKRVEEKGVSGHPPYDNLESFFNYNRAGENETLATKEEVIERLKVR
jgi:hypothetical protein